jgi:hypothetical protein
VINATDSSANTLEELTTPEESVSELTSSTKIADPTKEPGMF